MEINDDYQKRRGQITSFPTVEIIEPNRKDLESKSLYPLSNFYREDLKQNKKKNRSNKFA